MSNSILYYPTIEFRHEDYQWLWKAIMGKKFFGVSTKKTWKVLCKY